VRNTYTDGTVEYLSDNCEFCLNSSTVRCEHCGIVIAPDKTVRESVKHSLIKNAKIWQKLANC